MSSMSPPTPPCFDCIQGKSSRTASPKDGVRDEFAFRVAPRLSAKHPYIPVRRSRWGRGALGAVRVGPAMLSSLCIFYALSSLKLHPGYSMHLASSSGILAVFCPSESTEHVYPYQAYHFRNRDLPRALVDQTCRICERRPPSERCAAGATDVALSGAQDRVRQRLRRSYEVPCRGPTVSQ